MNKKNILVTGGAGFIGSHLTDKLISLGHKVVIIDDLSYGQKKNINKKAKFYKIKIQNKKVAEIFKKHKFDIVYHQAAQKNVRVSVDNPQLDANANIIGSLNLLENCRKYKVEKFIFASTGGAIYGDADILPTPEGCPEWPVSPYGVAKLAVEKYLHYYEQVHKLPYVCLRYANVFGPRQDPKGEAGVVAIFISKLLAGDKPIINGSGKQTRDYVFVDDVVQANILAIDSQVRGIYNVGTAKENNVNQLYNCIVKLLGLKTKEKHGPALAGEQMTSCLNIKKIKKLGYKVNYNLEKGLSKTIKWFNYEN